MEVVMDVSLRLRRGSCVDEHAPDRVAEHPQAEGLAKMLADIGQPLDRVIEFRVDPKLLVQRISGRRSCQDCGRVFNVHTAPVPVPPPCGGRCTTPRLVQRPDDTEATVAKRLSVYEEQTAPLVGFYAATGLLRKVEAEGELAAVTARVEAALAP